MCSMLTMEAEGKGQVVLLDPKLAGCNIQVSRTAKYTTMLPLGG